MRCFRSGAHGALVAGWLAAAVGAQRERDPARAGTPCRGCQCGDSDLTPYRSHDGGVFDTPADKDGYSYMFSMCDDIPPHALPVGCALPAAVEHPAVVRIREDNPSDCTVLGSFSPCESEGTCGMSYERLGANEAHGPGLKVFWQGQYGCQNVFQLSLFEGEETEPTRAPISDPNNPCAWTMTWESLGAFRSVATSKLQTELPTGADATFALLFCYVCWTIFTVMMISFALGISDRSQSTTAADTPDSQQSVAVERALRFHQLPRWQRRLVTFQWATCGNVLFIVASLVYVVASVLNFQLTYYDVAWVGDYYFYDKINLCGAIIFTIEPLIDIVGVIANTWFTTCDQAHWETFGRTQPFKSDSTLRSDTTPSNENSAQHTANPMSSSNAEDSNLTTGSEGSGLRDSPDGQYSQDKDPWLLTRAPTSQPWWKRWQWQGYAVWTKAPTIWQLVLQDLDLYAALFFFLASLGYLWAAALPWMYALNKHTENVNGIHLLCSPPYLNYTLAYDAKQ